MSSKPILRPLFAFLMNINKTLNDFKDNGFKLSIAENKMELEKNLKRLNIDINNLNCICCKTPIEDLSHLRGIYKHKGKIFSYCDKPECLLESSNRILT